MDRHITVADDLGVVLETELPFDLEDFIKQEVDDRTTNMDVSSEMGSPMGVLPPSPTLTEPVPSPYYPEDCDDFFDFDNGKPAMLDDLQWLSKSVGIDPDHDWSTLDLEPVDAATILADAEGNIFQPSSPAEPNADKNNSIELDEEKLVNLPVKELNRVLKGMPKDKVAKLKQKRRTLKNRGYAQNCRSKRMHQKESLEERNAELEKERNQYKQLCQQLLKERNSLKRQVEFMKRRSSTSSMESTKQ